MNSQPHSLRKRTSGAPVDDHPREASAGSNKPDSLSVRGLQRDHFNLHRLPDWNQRSGAEFAQGDGIKARLHQSPAPSATASTAASTAGAAGPTATAAAGSSTTTRTRCRGCSRRGRLLIAGRRRIRVRRRPAITASSTLRILRGRLPQVPVDPMQSRF